MSAHNELLWTTDVHLDHVGHGHAARCFGEALRREHPEASGLVVTGDIAEGPSVLGTLREFAHGFDKPLYFVLGNHDYYRSSFSEVDAELSREIGARSGHLHWLRKKSVWLQRPEDDNGGTLLLGNGGFYDGRFGDPSSRLELTDFARTRELFVAQDESRKALFQALADRADALALELQLQLKEESDQKPSLVIIATHVPPFQKAAFHQGRHSDDEWAPFFSSKVMGQRIIEHADQHPETRFLVLCGHTHGSGRFSPTANVEVVTGAARYGAPELAGRINSLSGEVADFTVG